MFQTSNLYYHGRKTEVNRKRFPPDGSKEAFSEAEDVIQ